ncbi:hypothetical protein [Pedobacter nototheniae]|uniref:hypothetical protein n=1 Tax=Pedobacter nototheniae TaxID=2488994 RepID=UPI00103F50C6|nr:hypothetical protein [Pedobacter nototheniae]
MKQKILLAFSLLAGPLAMAQNTFPNSGNVGIGTTSPQYLMQMMGEHNSTQFNMRWPHGDPLYQADLMLWASEPGISYTGVGIGNNVINGPSTITRILNTKGASYMRLLDSEIRLNVVQSNGTDIAALAINPNGNVGIGTASPTSLLQIGDFNTSVASKALLIPGVYNFEQLRLGQLGNGNSALEMINHNDRASSYGIRLMTNVDVAGGLQFQYALTTSSYESLSYQTTMFMDLNGRVGIGTLSPKEKLSVNGNIRAKEVKVEATGWPDYVFEKNYPLLSLEATEKHIKEKGYLPGMPSAKEVELNGLELGEMVKQLLKKQEELTLYLIHQQKEIQALKKKIIQQQKLFPARKTK